MALFLGSERLGEAFQRAKSELREKKSANASRVATALGIPDKAPVPASAPQTAPPAAASGPAQPALPAPITPEQHLSDLDSRMSKMEAEGRLLASVGGVGTDDYNKLVKQHRDLRGQQRFLQRAYVKPKTNINEHTIEALDRLRTEGQQG